ncbi:MAG: hypothetical protein ACKOTZ_10325, partial [Chloroflexota bacterium]
MIAAVAGVAIAAYAGARMRVAGLVLLAWTGAAIVIGSSPLPSGQARDVVGFLVFGALAFAPAVALLLAAWRLPRVRALVDRTPTAALVLTQAYRVGGVFLVLAYQRGELPAEVGLVSGVLDLLVATTAVLLAIHLRHDGSRSARLVIAWATLGLVDFGWAMIVITASFLGLITLDPAPIIMGNPPLLVISLFALPFGIFISVVLIARMRVLRREGGTAAREEGRSATWRSAGALRQGRPVEPRPMR